MSKAETVDELETAFDAGEDMDEFFDFAQATLPNRDPKRVNVDLLQWIITGLDNEAARLGINRQAVIKA